MQGKQHRESMALPTLLILIGGHLSAAPRAQKEAMAAVAAGFKVLICGNTWSARLAEEDKALAEKLNVELRPVVDFREGGPGTLWIKLRQRLAGELCRRFQIQSVRAMGVGGPEMLRRVLSIRPQLTTVHFEAGLWVGRKLLRRGFRVGVDFEDWFSEDLPASDRLGRPIKLLKGLETELLHKAAFTSTTTLVMAKALAREAQTERVPQVVPNCFPWRDAPLRQWGESEPRSSSALSLYWFSQTIGPSRGLEALGEALARVSGDWELHLRGDLRHYREWFESTFSESLRTRIHLHEPCSNAELPRRTASHDVGLALEIPYCKNKDLTASNKIFEYLRCGLPVIATDTAGQREVMNQNPEAGWIVSPSDVEALRSTLQQCIDDRAAVKRAGAAAALAASGRWAWESFERSLGMSLRRAAGLEE